MLDFTIYSYGYSELIYHTLQAIAMFRNSNFYTSVITTVSLLAGLTYAIQMAAASSDDQWRSAIRRVMAMGIFIQALLLPTATMAIKDNVEKHYWQVDNIPLAFALPIGVIENFGHILAAGFDQVYSLVDGASAHSYYHYGTVFGARLQKEVLQAKVRDPEFISNMSNFIERCVILPSMIGKQFTKEELVESEDMWGLISSTAGTFTRTPMTVNGTRVDPHPKCKDAVPYFEKKFTDAIGSNVTSWSWKFQGAGKDANYNPASRALNQNIKAQIGVLYKNNSSVDALLKHNMMINAVNSYRSGKYPAAKAQLHNEAGGLISGDLAEKTLTGSLAIMKIIVYGSFIFLFPMLILTGGIAKYKAWITAAFSLALWSPLFSMINMVIDFAYQPATIVSYSSWSTELKKFDSIASTAANLSLMIPFLAFWLTRMAEGGFMHLAGSVMANANSAASAMAGEKASGRREWDSESIRNQNNDNVSSNKHDSSMQYVSGAARSMMSDGSMEMIRPDGKAVYFGGAGQSTSSGETRYTEGSGFNMHREEGVRRETQEMESETATRSTAFDRMVASEASALHSLAQNTKTDNGYNIDTSTEEGREVMKTLNAIDRLNDTNNYTWEQNAEAHLKGEVDPMLAAGRIAKYVAGVDVKAGGSVTAGNSSSQQVTGVNDIESGINSNNKSGTTDRASEHSAYLESKGVDKNTQDSVRESYQEVERLDKSIAQHKSNIDSHNKTYSFAESNSSEMSKDITQDVADHYQKLHGGSARDAHEAVSKKTDKAQEAFRDFTSAKYQEKFNEIKSQGEQIQTSNKVGDFASNNQINSNIGDKRDQFAKENNIDTDIKSAETKMTGDHDRMKDQYEQGRYKNTMSYIKEQHDIKDKQSDKQEKIDKYEEDRIGKGFAASNIVNPAANIVTLGNAGNSIGRPKENVKSDLDLGDPIGKPYEPKGGTYDLKTKEFTPFPKGHKPRYSFNNTGGQYVDPKKK
ncbi:conjugal transfer protein TraG N-terminal domain-containing protein [Rickettsiaceae bacterium]|nr:conjugal transfer protein TraG N-terminal domain-containing protein [Rickettsiaceae bacterium]